MARTFEDAREWMSRGFELFSGAALRLGEAEMNEPSLLPGWTRRHVVSHVAANADALSNLVHWAATGEPTPMYASPDERAAGIERGLGLDVPTLTG
jgi:maleylpyruvate isomerase